MEPINELDQAELKHEFRELYKDKGYVVCVQVLYELVLSANILISVIMEENNIKEDNTNNTSDYND